MVQSDTVEMADFEMNPLWTRFLRTKVNSFIKWDLVRFFHDNPHTVDNAENIARFVGRDARTTQRELDGLVAAGVLELEAVATGTIYRLTRDEQTRQLIHKFMDACYDREFRVKAINHVILGMGFTPNHDF